MSLAKIPILTVLTYLFRVILTPPQPPASADEVKPSVRRDSNSRRRYRLQAARYGQYLLASAEIAVLVASKYPTSPISQQLLPILLPGDRDPSQLRLSPISILGAALWAFGAVVRIRSYQNLGRLFKFEVSIQKGHSLIKTGPYAYVRHPSYTGLTLATVGWLMWNYAPGSWASESGFLNSNVGRIIFMVYLANTLFHMQWVTLTRMSKEDEALKKEFGKEWDEWAKKVPYSIIPGIY